ERRVRIARAREGIEQGRRQLRQNLASAGALQRRSASEMPAANRLRRRLGTLEAETAERRERLGIVGHAGEDEIAGCGAESGRILEQARVVLFDLGQMEGQVARE